MKQLLFKAILVVLFCTSVQADPGDGNRLTYLDELNPYYPHKDFPKLVTPQWVGEEGVECVVVLAIDDMRDPKKYEEYLRPILIRLKQIDGRAPVSIMTCNIDPQDEQIQQWLAEGLSIEVHTVDHPCPLLQGGDFQKAKSTYDRCVDLMNAIPGNKPVAFRMPCCDSLNTVSPRFYAEIFNKTTEKDNYLQISSSVFNVFTSDDPEIPRGLVLDADGNERFKKLIPKNLNRNGKAFNTFVNTIENYPYPYVIGNLCWEFPCVAPSDWSAQHYRGKNNPQTVEDLKAALDITVHKKGVFNLVFHPHGWIRNDQVVDLIDHAVKKHGKNVKFLTFKEALERLNKNLIPVKPWRHPGSDDTLVRLLDINKDGLMDVVWRFNEGIQSRVWSPEDRSWKSSPSPGISASLPPQGMLKHARFATLHEDSFPSILYQIHFEDSNGREAGLHFDGKQWLPDQNLKSLPVMKHIGRRLVDKGDFGIRFRDLDRDGCCELIVGTPKQGVIYQWRSKRQTWNNSPFALPIGTSLVDTNGRDAGLRFVDLNEDGFDDVVFSNHERYGIWLFKDMQSGWSVEVLSGERGKQASGRREPAGSSKHQGADAPRSQELPPIVREDGSNNGFFVHSRHLFWQNEDTADLLDLVDRRSFDDLLKDMKPAAKSPEMSLKAIVVKPGFTAELVAAEPLVKDPVAFEWGADGKLWVAEMADYPVGTPPPESPPYEEGDKQGASPPYQGGDKQVASPTSQGRDDQNSSPPLQGGDRGGVSSGGRVRFLEDTDGDGRYDKSTLFLDGLNFPNGVMPWKKGVLITASPDILYAEDTDGDGKADVKKVLFTGLGQGNQQHRANGLAYGLDHWVYCANGDSNGRIQSVGRTPSDAVSRSPDRDTPATEGLPNRSGDLRSGQRRGRETRAEQRTPPLQGRDKQVTSPPLQGGDRGGVTDISGRDFRINPDTGQLDPQSGRTQFGRNRDNWGNWFGCNNSNPHYHFVLADHYLRRNPYVAFPDPLKHVSVTPGAAPCYPVSREMARFNDYNKLNRFTSACGAIIHRDDLFGKKFAGNSFVSEPVHNLVHREIVTPEGVTFTSRRAEDEQTSEFLASRDNWFRPTMLKTGPDGALYIADMYRLVIEHPQYIPKELQQGWDMRAGEDRGRIYKVYPTGKKLRAVPRLDKLSTAELAAALDSDSSWQRDTVQRLLIHRQDRAAVSILEEFVLSGKSDREHQKHAPPLTRLHALCSLDGLHALKPEILRQALGDLHPGVRRHAVRLCERLLQAGRAGEIAGSLLRLVDDPDPHVRMQLAYSLGEWDDEQSGTALAGLLRNAGGDRYLSAAVMSSVNKKNLDPLLAGIFRHESDRAVDPAVINPLFRLAAVLGNESTLVSLLQMTTQPDEDNRHSATQMVATARLLNSLNRRGMSVEKLLDKAQNERRVIQPHLQKMLKDARLVAGGKIKGAGEADRLAAIELLPLDSASSAGNIKILSELLQPRETGRIQSAAVAALGRFDDASGDRSVPESLLSGWKTYGPGLRSEVLDVFLSRQQWTKQLLEYVAKDRIAPAEIDASRRQRLLTHRNRTLRKEAETVFAGSLDTNRGSVLEAYRSSLTLSGDVQRGRQLFAKTCANCHKLDGVGHEVGPDLAALKDKSPESQLVAILDPNRNVESKYLNYVAVTSEGRSFNGLIANETGNSIALLAPEGKKQVILRGDLEELVGTSKSTMPEGLEKDLQPQDVADVMAYVASTGERFRPNGRFPRTIRPRRDGSIELAADNCEIYGPTLVLEQKHNNLGYWGSAQDRAIWPISVPREGEYAIRLTWACPEETAGNNILFRCGTFRETARVQSTGNWETYREAEVGRIQLPQGSQRFEIRAAGELKGYLLDLKSVRLVPVQGKQER